MIATRPLFLLALACLGLSPRIARAQAFMQAEGIAAVYLNAGTNMSYFTGTKWYASERMVGAILPASGALAYIAPAFEESTIGDFMLVEGEVHCWEEHESPYQLFIDVLGKMGIAPDAARPPRIGICESAAFFIADGIKPLACGYALENARSVTAHCRTRKSPNEIALMQRAKDMTLAVHVATASILRPGITTDEIDVFVHDPYADPAEALRMPSFVVIEPAPALPFFTILEASDHAAECHDLSRSARWSGPSRGSWSSSTSCSPPWAWAPARSRPCRWRRPMP